MKEVGNLMLGISEEVYRLLGAPWVAKSQYRTVIPQLYNQLEVLVCFTYRNSIIAA